MKRVKGGYCMSGFIPLPHSRSMALICDIFKEKIVCTRYYQNLGFILVTNYLKLALTIIFDI